MTVRIGVIGTGNIGAYHIDTLTGRVAGAEVAAVFDVAADRAAEVGSRAGARVLASAEAVIDDPAVDAVLVASPGELHAPQVLASIARGKPVLCEKPLAPSTAACLEVLDAEVAHGSRLVQLGFMRRHDPAYLDLKAVLARGEVGDALMLHCVHRNADVHHYFTSDMSLTDSVVHEMDSARWLLDDEITAVTVVAGKQSPDAAMADPQLVLLEMGSGVLVDVESFVNARYGYEVRCELVGSMGAATVDLPSGGTVTRSGRRGLRVAPDWRERFDAAYHAELQTWVHGVRTGRIAGASAWDGYAATAVAQAGLRARAEGRRVEVELVDRPAFYAPDFATA